MVAVIKWCFVGLTSFAKLINFVVINFIPICFNLNYLLRNFDSKAIIIMYC